MNIDIMYTGISIFRIQDGYLVSVYLDVGDPWYAAFNKGINELTHRTKRVVNSKQECSTCKFWHKLEAGLDGTCEQMEDEVTGPTFDCNAWERI